MMASVCASVCWCAARLMTLTSPPPALAIAAASAFWVTKDSMVPEPPNRYTVVPFGGSFLSFPSS